MQKTGWTLAIFSRGGLPPLLGGLIVFAGYWAVLLVSLAVAGWLGELDTGGEPPWRTDLLWDNLVSSVLCAYFSVATVYGLRGTERDLEALRPVVPGGETDFAAFGGGALRFNARRRRIGGFVVVIVGVILQLLFVWAFRGRFQEPMRIDLAVGLARVPAIGWFAYRAIYFDVTMMLAFLRAGRSQVRVPLFDPEALAPFSRHGLRAALLWFIGCILFSLFTVTKSSGIGDILWLTLLMTFATSNLLVPVWGVHERLRATKARELRAVRRALFDRYAEDEATAADRAARIAPLLTLEARLERVREWPFDALTLVRFFFFATLAIGSWLGGALVEVALDAVLRR